MDPLLLLVGAAAGLAVGVGGALWITRRKAERAPAERIAAEAAVKREPWTEGDPGDEDDWKKPKPVAPPPPPVPPAPPTVTCPLGHPALLRDADKSVLCLTCSELYLARDFAEEYQLNEAA